MRYIVPFLFISFLSFSQINDSIGDKRVKIKYDFSLKLDSLSKIKPIVTTNFKKNKPETLSVYDRNTKLNSIYYLANDSVYLVKTVSLNASQVTPKDSFNPYGVSNMGAGLIMGSITTVFNTVFKR